MFDIKSLKKKVELHSLDGESLAVPKGYISTGNLAVNKIISGSMFKGIPSNRITTFYGESGCVVPTTKICVMLRPDAFTFQHVEPLADRESFAEFVSRISTDEKFACVRGIGYHFCDLCKKIGRTRQMVWKVRTADSHNRTFGDNCRTIKEIDDFILSHIFMTEIGNIPEFRKNKVPFLLLTPVGFRKCSNLVDRGERECFEVETAGGFKGVFSKDHVVMMEDGRFNFVDNVHSDFCSGGAAPVIQTLTGPRKVVGMKVVGVKRTYDIEVDDDRHTYFTDGIVSHNSGKSLIVSEIIIDALKNKNYDAVFYLDSEGGLLYDKLASSGIDTTKMFHVPVSTIEEATETLQNIYADITEQCNAAAGDESKMPHVLVVVDSISGLVTTKTITDAVGGKVVQDMGLEAKLRNKMIKALMVTVMRTGCPMVCIAHAYDNMNAMGPQKFKEMAGGNGAKYSSHIIVQSTKSRKRQEDSSLGLKGGGSYYAANAIRYITYKNRLVKEGLETTMYVDLNKGISKYAGLWDDAIRLGFIKQQGAWYTVPSYKDPEHKFRRDDIAENDEIWNLFLDDMDKIFIKETAYGVGDYGIGEAVANG